MRTIKLITRFYRGIFVINFLITLSCVYLVLVFGQKAFEILMALFWYKVIAILLVFYTSVYYRQKELYYYQNLGVSKLRLCIATSAFDFLLWIVMVTLAFKTIS
jgi:hypothetical protein